MLANTEKQKKRDMFKLFRELFAIIFWCYVVAKVAIFDFDTYIITKYFPDMVQVLYYKLFLFAAIISILWLVLGKKRFPLFVLFIVAYPIIIMGWRIPKTIFRNWSISIIFAPSIFEVVTKFRTYFIISSFVLLSTVLVLTSHNKILLSISMLILAMFLVRHLYLSFSRAYRSTVFSRLQVIISKFKNKLSDNSFIQAIMTQTKKTNEGKSDEELLQSQISILYTYYSYAMLLEKKAEYFMQSRKMDLYLILTWFCTVLVTAVIYSLEYFSLYKILPSAFSSPFQPTYFSFLGFSFGKLTTTTISAIVPTNLIAILLCYSELACTLIIFVILVFTILTAARERYKEDLNNIVKEISEMATIFQSAFNIMFNMALAEAEYILFTHNASLVNDFRKRRGLPELSEPNSHELKCNVVGERESSPSKKPNKIN